jgi:hypothetical protein
LYSGWLRQGFIVFFIFFYLEEISGKDSDNYGIIVIFAPRFSIVYQVTHQNYSYETNEYGYIQG